MYFWGGGNTPPFIMTHAYISRSQHVRACLWVLFKYDTHEY